MSATTTSILQDLSATVDYYNAALDLYDRGSRRIERTCEWVDQNLPELARTIETTLPKDQAFNVLSVGPGDGVSDSRILTHLRDMAHPKIHSVILEPDAHMIQQYQDLVSTESTKLQGIDFDWRQQTFQEFQTISKEDDKFDFISCISSIYYLGDIDTSLKYLYDKLNSGGILVITLMAGEGGFGRLWQFLHKKLGRRGNYFTSSDVIAACRRQKIAILETQTIKIHCDISLCFEPTQHLSEDGNTLLDFLTHTVNFAQNSPAECRDDALRFLGSEACSERGPSGEVMFNGSNAAVIIRRV